MSLCVVGINCTPLEPIEQRHMSRVTDMSQGRRLLAFQCRHNPVRQRKQRVLRLPRPIELARCPRLEVVRGK